MSDEIILSFVISNVDEVTPVCGDCCINNVPVLDTIEPVCTAVDFADMSNVDNTDNVRRVIRRREDSDESSHSSVSDNDDSNDDNVGNIVVNSDGEEVEELSDEDEIQRFGEEDEELEIPILEDNEEDEDDYPNPSDKYFNELTELKQLHEILATGGLEKAGMTPCELDNRIDKLRRILEN